MQNANEPVGYWFLYKEHIVLRIYRFTEEPYKLLTFLTKRIFVLEFLRQRLHVESKIFPKHKKYFNIKFKYTIEPFVVDSTSALQIDQDILKSMKFELDRKVNYDPKQFISHRKVSCGIGSFEHQNDEELEAKANVEYT